MTGACFRRKVSSGSDSQPHIGGEPLLITGAIRSPGIVLILGCAFLLAAQAKAQSDASPLAPNVGTKRSSLPDQSPSDGRAEKLASEPGSIRGRVVDFKGDAIIGAHVKLTGANQTYMSDVDTDEEGQFVFQGIAAGEWKLTISAEGFSPQTMPLLMHSGDKPELSPITLSLATEVTEVRVSLSTVEMAQEQIRDQEKQRLLGIVPNFYVSYIPDAAPLSTRQKFELAWKSTIDPVSLTAVGVIAGVDHASNRFSGYGQEWAGFGKRYAASYGNFVIGTYMRGAVLPTVFRQDPRYFYKGTGSKRSRLLYAMANSVIFRGNNKHWQPNYSSILGHLAAGGISNLYYPPQDRHGASLTFENALIGIGASTVINVLQEFVFRKITPSASHQ